MTIGHMDTAAKPSSETCKFNTPQTVKNVQQYFFILSRPSLLLLIMSAEAAILFNLL